MKFIINKSPSPPPTSTLTKEQQFKRDQVMEISFYDLYVLKHTYKVMGWMEANDEYSQGTTDDEIEAYIEDNFYKWAWNAIKGNCINDYANCSEDEEGQLPKLVT